MPYLEYPKILRRADGTDPVYARDAAAQEEALNDQSEPSNPYVVPAKPEDIESLITGGPRNEYPRRVYRGPAGEGVESKLVESKDDLVAALSDGFRLLEYESAPADEPKGRRKK